MGFDSFPKQYSLYFCLPLKATMLYMVLSIKIFIWLAAGVIFFNLLFFVVFETKDICFLFVILMLLDHLKMLENE